MYMMAVTQLTEKNLEYLIRPESFQHRKSRISMNYSIRVALCVCVHAANSEETYIESRTL